MADLSNTKLVDLLPASISGDANVIAAASAIDGELQKVTALIPETVLIARIDVLPEKVLDLLAWQWHIDFYEPVGFGVEKKRAVIKNSIAWHRKKGTPWAVAQVVSATFDTADIQEWFTYGGDPYHFRIKTIDNLPDGEAYTLLKRAIDTAKNTRSWLDKITIQHDVTFGDGHGGTGLKLGFLTGMGGKQTIGLPVPTGGTVQKTIGFARRWGGLERIGLSVPTGAPVKLFAGALIRRGGKITIGRSA